MSYTFNLPNQSDNTQYIFQSGYWTKPLGITMVNILLVGAGGGGGGGFTGIAGSNRGGGGGGGGGGTSRLTIPAIFLPDTLKITIGSGGAGSTGSGVAGSTGGGSIVEVARGTGVQASYLLFVNGGGGGGAGTAAARGTSGAAATLANATNAIFSNLGVTSLIAGQIGVTGGLQTGGIGSNVTYTTTPGYPFSSGAGGAGVSTTNFAGGYVNTGGIILAQQLGGLAGGGDGGDGIFSQYPFYATGGSGGGSNNTGTGGKGGNGAIGCGGAGGGGGTTGGRGGTGGNGLCIITCW
jgi:hypothetical protein